MSFSFSAKGPGPFSAAAEFQDSGIAESDESHHSTETGHHQQVNLSEYYTITANTVQIHSPQYTQFIFLT